MEINDITDKVQINSHKNAKIARMNKERFSTEKKYKKVSSTTDYMKPKNQLTWRQYSETHASQRAERTEKL